MNDSKDFVEKENISSDDAYTFMYYSKLLKKPFETLASLIESEKAWKANMRDEELKKAAEKTKEEQLKQESDALKEAEAKVDETLKALNIARKLYKEKYNNLSAEYTENLNKLNKKFKSDKFALQSDLSKAEADYSKALKTYVDKYKYKTYELVLKDGDAETAINNIGLIFNLI